LRSNSWADNRRNKESGADQAQRQHGVADLGWRHILPSFPAASSVSLTAVWWLGQSRCACPVGLSQPTVSHHLKILVDAGMLTREQRGKWAYYRLVPGALDALAALITSTEV